jgi:hypothetical protein
MIVPEEKGASQRRKATGGDVEYVGVGESAIDGKEQRPPETSTIEKQRNTGGFPHAV